MRVTLDPRRPRVETKYRVAVEDVPALLRRIPADDREDYGVRTLYFDHPDGSLARKALEDPLLCTKVRAREYHDGSPWIWFEVKNREGRWTRKSRLKLSRAQAGRWITGTFSASEESIVAPESEGDGDNDARRYLQAVLRRDLLPIGAVVAFRRSFTLKKDIVRITLDQEITYHRPAVSSSGQPGMIGALLRRESSPVLEVKHVGTVPSCCLELVEPLRRSTYSKFRTLVQSLAESGMGADRVDRL